MWILYVDVIVTVSAFKWQTGHTVAQVYLHGNDTQHETRETHVTWRWTRTNGKLKSRCFIELMLRHSSCSHLQARPKRDSNATILNETHHPTITCLCGLGHISHTEGLETVSVAANNRIPWPVSLTVSLHCNLHFINNCKVWQTLSKSDHFLL